MHAFRRLLVLGLAAAGLTVPLAAQAPAALSIRPVRYYRSEQNQPATRVRAFIQIPLSVMDPAPEGLLSYQVSVKVSDASGLQLHTDAWRNHAPAAARASGGYGMDMIDFALAPGTFKVDVTVTDSVSGRQLAGSAAIEGFTAAPELSDLLLASAMRIADANDTVPAPGELRRGNTLMTAAATLRLTPLRTSAFYLLEAYNPGATDLSGTMGVAIDDASGKTIFKTAPTPVRIAAGGGLLKGSVDLEGLPPGSYAMRVSVALPGGTFERAAPFEMAGLEESLARDTMRIAAERVGDEGYFQYMSGEQLDSAFAPLLYVAKPAELKAWKKDMSDEAKQRYLTQFWSQRDPSPGTQRNEIREAFYDAIDFANRTYSERRVPGWKTDRGRIYAKYGAPDDVLRRLQEISNSRPYEVWRYTRGRQRWYVFADRSSLGNFKLVHTNDVQENRMPDWREILGEDTVRDIGRFLNVDFYTESTQQFIVQ